MVEIATVVTVIFLILVVVPQYPLFRLRKWLTGTAFLKVARISSLSFAAAGIVSFLGREYALYVTLALMVGFFFYSVNWFILLRDIRKLLESKK